MWVPQQLYKETTAFNELDISSESNLQLLQSLKQLYHRLTLNYKTSAPWIEPVPQLPDLQ